MAVRKQTGFSATKDNKPTGLLLSETSPFHISESFKTVRTNLLFALATKNSRAFVVSSPMPDEGKSTISANLAIVLAQTGAQVLLIDCDLRKSSINRLFKLPTHKGLTSILCGIDKIEEALNENVVQNLDIITAGPTSPNPSELLGSTRMSEFLSIVQKGLRLRNSGHHTNQCRFGRNHCRKADRRGFAGGQAGSVAPRPA